MMLKATPSALISSQQSYSRTFTQRKRLRRLPLRPKPLRPNCSLLRSIPRHHLRPSPAIVLRRLNRYHNPRFCFPLFHVPLRPTLQIPHAQPRIEMLGRQYRSNLRWRQWSDRLCLRWVCGAGSAVSAGGEEGAVESRWESGI